MAVLVVGDANPDLVLTGDVVPRFGQAEQDVAAEVALGGSGAIAAAALARLGVDVAIAAAVGDDDLGRLVAARLEARGVARDALHRSAAPTGLSVHLLRDGDRAILTSTCAIADLDIAAACAAIGPAVRHVHVSSVYLIPPLVAGAAACWTRRARPGPRCRSTRTSTRRARSRSPTGCGPRT